MTREQPTDDELIQHGLYDPDAPNAVVRHELIDFLVSIGATLDDLVAYRDEMPSLGTVVVARPGTPRYTTHDVISKTGMSRELLLRLWRAAGFPEQDDDDVAFSDQDLQTLQLIAAACLLFGEDAVMSLTRVIGSSLAKIADAAVSSFLVNIEVPIVAQEPQDLAIAKANYAAASLLPGLSQAMDAILRHHILAARRSLMAWQQTGAVGYEVQQLAVGFIDLVGSTELAQELPTADLGSVLTSFENIVSDEVVARRGRVVKLIGDEAMFVAPDIGVACDVALKILEMLADDPALPAARVGIAAGELLSRDGDYFGPVVNLAARIVKAAEPGHVFTLEAERDRLIEAGLELSSAGTHQMKGFPASELLRVSRSAHP